MHQLREIVCVNSLPEPVSGTPLEETEVQDLAAREVSQTLSLRSLQTPGAVPGYQIEQCLGEGSFGSVWLARELRTGKKVAIKFYARGRGVDWSLLSREVEKLAVLYTSRNIVRLLDVAWDHDPPYFVMEYLENGSLAQRLERGRLPIEDAVRIARVMTQALIHAHGSGVLHCDLKPANVLFDAGGDARLCDFGQSRLSSERTPSLGTLFYMAPEQAVLDGVPDARWDVYALGALLYQMLTGSPPGRSPALESQLQRATSTEDRLATYRRLLLEIPPPQAHREIPGIDRRLIEIVDRCLERDPARRLANAQLVFDLLEQRDRARSRKQVVLLALFGPILFLIAMYWMADSATSRIVKTAEENLLQRALAGEVISARILAESVNQEILNRIEELEAEAVHPDVRQYITAATALAEPELVAICSEKAPGQEALVSVVQRLNAVREKSSKRHQDRSWFLTNAQGRQIYRNPVEGGTVGSHFHHRDYFHGQGRDFPESATIGSLMPRKVSGVSAAYQSSATGQFAIAIAVPVWDESHQQVLGVLGRSLHLTDLLNPWEDQLKGEARADQRFLALAQFVEIGEQGRKRLALLDHHWMTAANMAQRTEPPYIDETQASIIQRSETERTDRYHDPIGEFDPNYQGNWLAAWSRVQNTQWIAIVQERRDIALKPIDDLKNVFVRLGSIAIGVFSAMLLAFWLLLRRLSM